VRDVVERIISSGYDADKFTLSLSLPISLSIRQHALWLHLGKYRYQQGAVMVSDKIFISNTGSILYYKYFV
jgi:hypothetical protein